LDKEAIDRIIIMETLLNDQLGFSVPSFLTIIVMLMVVARLRQFVRLHQDNSQLVKVTKYIYFGKRKT
jgi:hypothetical protein